VVAEPSVPEPLLVCTTRVVAPRMARSGLPSPLKSPATVATVAVPVEVMVPGVKSPRPLLAPTRAEVATLLAARSCWRPPPA